MYTRGFLAVVALFFFEAAPGCAQSSSSPAISSALSGRVRSVEEGPMEGVLVSVKRAGSTMTITVVSDEQGRYRFPVSKLAPGQ
jgi:virginiamycin B lyase